MAGSLLFGIASASRVSNILHKGRNKGSCEHTYRLRVVSHTLPVISFNLPHTKRISPFSSELNTKREKGGIQHTSSFAPGPPKNDLIQCLSNKFLIARNPSGARMFNRNIAAILATP